ncbi:gp436 family protein [Ochrobactrum chromiisoli]|uniref:DUF1320 domain-containing protein n=1 Tax=Ochrobactrum chromiisoli TaxID=2993941 RepID=A0ABT3QNB9_9HYPH|nr:DUF1320 domain-containing protein [Ochrobactrum chromiisoli]MCX2697070.1 DUF1320 domain-containing protein [Ochrobactrum chromiisoli]
MTYATLDDLIARASLGEIRQIADRNRDGEIDPEVIAEALTHADNIVNGYVAAKYKLPFAAVPDLVRTWAISIARHKLHFQGPPEYVVNDYKDALAALKDVARGALALPVADGEIPQASAGGVIASHPAEVFSNHGLRGW